LIATVNIKKSIGKIDNKYRGWTAKDWWYFIYDE